MICNIQYACQKFYFGAMAEGYFDNKMKEIASKTQHQQKTSIGFNRLPEEFTLEDVARCFQLNGTTSAYSKIRRLLDDKLIEKICDSRGRDNEVTIYRKTGALII